jgi:hypothetical protein
MSAPSSVDPPLVVVLTAAVAVVAFSWSKLLGLPWMPAMAGASTIALLWISRQSVREVGSFSLWLRSRSTLIGAGLLTLSLGLRFYPLMAAFAPPGGDMSMHTLLVRVATENAILPDSQTPLYPGVPYGPYPLGFHGLAALVAGTPDRVGLATRIVMALTHALLAAGIYAVLRSRSNDILAGLTALATVLILRNPQNYVAWGGYPCLLGFAFGILAWQSLNDYLRKMSPQRGGLVIVLTATTALTHPTAAITLAVALISTVVVAFARPGRLNLLRAALLVGVGSLVLAAPILVEAWNVEYSSGESAWVAANHLSPPQSPKPSRELLPDYWDYAFGDGALLVGGLGLLVLFLGRRWREGLGLAFLLVATPYLATWYRHSGNPGSLSLYPERVMLALVVPWAILISQVLRAISRFWRREFPKWRSAQRPLAIVLSLGILTASGINYDKYYVRSARSSVVVKAVDVRAFDEIRLLASSTSLVSNRVGDAAAFLPGMWGVAATSPQYNPIWWDELESWLGKHEADFLYCRSDKETCGGVLMRDGREREYTLTFASDGDTVTVWHLQAEASLTEIEERR